MHSVLIGGAFAATYHVGKFIGKLAEYKRQVIKQSKKTEKNCAE